MHKFNSADKRKCTTFRILNTGKEQRKSIIEREQRKIFRSKSVLRKQDYEHIEINQNDFRKAHPNFNDIALSNTFNSSRNKSANSNRRMQSICSSRPFQSRKRTRNHDTMHRSLKEYNKTDCFKTIATYESTDGFLVHDRLNSAQIRKRPIFASTNVDVIQKQMKLACINTNATKQIYTKY